MGKVVLSHISALLWLVNNRNYRMDSNSICKASLAGAICPDENLAAHLLNIGFGGDKIDCLVGERCHVRRNAHVRGYLHSGKLPDGSLIPVECRYESTDLYVCAPEFVFYQLAAKLSTAEAVYFGMALCSEFRLEPSAVGGVVYRHGYDSALTTVEKITSYLNRIGAERVPRRALSALKYVAGGARSPKECGLGMLFSLPSSLGGFDLGKLSFNIPFPVYRGVDIYGNDRKGNRIPDIVLENTDGTGRRRFAAVDYDPSVTHAGGDKERSDAWRRNEIAGIRNLSHYSLTSDDIRSFEYLELTAERIRRALGRRKHPCLHCSADSYEGRMILREAKENRVALWNQFVRTPFNGVVDGLPLERKRPRRVA